MNENFLTLNNKCFCPLNTLYILKSGSAWKYLSNAIKTFIIEFVLFVPRLTKISPSTIVVNAQSKSTLKPGRFANEPLRQIIRNFSSFNDNEFACSEK